MRFYVSPTFDGVIMDGHPPATPASTTQNIECPSILTPSKMGKTKISSFILILSYNCDIFAFYRWDLFVKDTITSFHWPHLNNYTRNKNKCFNPRNQNQRVTFVTR